MQRSQKPLLGIIYMYLLYHKWKKIMIIEKAKVCISYIKHWLAHTLS